MQLFGRNVQLRVGQMVELEFDVAFDELYRSAIPIATNEHNGLHWSNLICQC